MWAGDVDKDKGNDPDREEYSVSSAAEAWIWRSGWSLSSPL